MQVGDKALPSYGCLTGGFRVGNQFKVPIPRSEQVTWSGLYELLLTKTFLYYCVYFNEGCIEKILISLLHDKSLQYYASKTISCGTRPYPAFSEVPRCKEK